MSRTVEPKIGKLISLKVPQYKALQIIKMHSGLSPAHLINKGIDAVIADYEFLLKDCKGIDLNKEVAKMAA